MAETGGRDHAALICDTNILVRYLTNEPQSQARAAERVLAGSTRVVLTDVVVAEATYVLEGMGGFERARVAEAIGRFMELESVEVADRFLLRDALGLWSTHGRLHFVDAYLAALDRRTAGTAVLSFDRDFDRIEGVTRVDPARY